MEVAVQEGSDGVLDADELALRAANQLIEQRDKLQDGAQVEEFARAKGEAALKQIDANGDGVVDEAEFAAVGGSEFNKYDLNGDGVLDADELALRAVAKEKGASDLKSMDTNNDGLVDEVEFVAAGGSQAEFDEYDMNGAGALHPDCGIAEWHPEHTCGTRGWA